MRRLLEELVRLNKSEDVHQRSGKPVLLCLKNKAKKFQLLSVG